jgi:hypothetical protein
MILKIIHCYDHKVHDIFYDGFDSVRVNHCDFTKEILSCAYPCSIYDKEGTKLNNSIRLELVNGDNILHRAIYVDPSISIYLMSNEGKTIERIN